MKRNLKTRKNVLQGIVKRNPDGFGFLIPEDKEHPDVYLPRHCMTGIMTNDVVMVNVEAERGGERFRGEIIKVVKRGLNRVVGKYVAITESEGFIKDDSKAWGMDLKLRNDGGKKAKNNELVAAEITSFPDENDNFRGKIIEVIGSVEDPMTDIRRVLHQQNIPEEFSKQTLHEARSFPLEVTEKDKKNRRDLQHLNFVTIDGATAKDFDDAIYVETDDNGFRLFVAIADVSHYVQTGSGIDQDAWGRGTSVYFPNFVVPMLPEVLSNELCSLKPKVPRLSLVAEMKMDFSGVVTASEFYEAVIESKARVTYGEAQELIEENDLEKLRHVKADIQRAGQLAKILMAKRSREGSLDLEIPETQLVIDAAGNPVDILRSERLFAHKLIEELMLAANVAVAEFLTSRDVPCLYRIHDRPNQDALETLERYLISFGSKIDLGQGQLQKRLTKALESFAGKPEALILNILTLRSMAQAKYSPDNVGHFGLGFENYAHFTSPIRRYPDLIIHRILKSQVTRNHSYKAMSVDDLETAGLMLSACEQRAVKAERQLTGIKKARFMQKHVGKTFEGMISSVAKFGIFVLLREFEVDGLVHIENLSKEKMVFDEEHLRLVGKRSGFSFSIGDTVTIRVAAANIDEGQIDFELAEAPETTDRPHEKHKEMEKERPSSSSGHSKNKSPRRGGPTENWKERPQNKTRIFEARPPSPRQIEADGPQSKKDYWIKRLDEAIMKRSQSPSEDKEFARDRRHDDKKKKFFKKDKSDAGGSKNDRGRGEFKSSQNNKGKKHKKDGGFRSKRRSR